MLTLKNKQKSTAPNPSLANFTKYLKEDIPEVTSEGTPSSPETPLKGPLLFRHTPNSPPVGVSSTLQTSKPYNTVFKFFSNQETFIESLTEQIATNLHLIESAPEDDLILNLNVSVQWLENLIAEEKDRMSDSYKQYAYTLIEKFIPYRKTIKTLDIEDRTTASIS